MAHKLVTQVHNPDENANEAQALELDNSVYIDSAPQEEKKAVVQAAPAQPAAPQSFWSCLCKCLQCTPCMGAPAPPDPPSPAPFEYQPPGGRLPVGRYLLPQRAPEDENKRTLVLDLDETLVHSSFKPVPNADFVISIELENEIHHVYVLKRPGVDEFLETVAKKFEVVIFTASLAKYADPLLDILDPKRTVRARLFREACVQHYGNYVKDLSLLGRDEAHIIIIDNSPYSYIFQPDNAVPITSWFSDPNDRQLWEIIPILDQLATVDDVRLSLAKRNDASHASASNGNS